MANNRWYCQLHFRKFSSESISSRVQLRTNKVRYPNYVIRIKLE